VGEHEDRRVVGRLGAPPSIPVLIPLAADRPEHVAAHDVGPARSHEPASAVASASFARSSPRCQLWTSLPRFPSGFSRLWSGPATKPSSEIDMWQVVSGIKRPVVR